MARVSWPTVTKPLVAVIRHGLPARPPSSALLSSHPCISLKAYLRGYHYAERFCPTILARILSRAPRSTDPSRAPGEPAPDLPPEKQNRLRALILKAKTRYAKKKQGTAIGQQATNLIFIAHNLDYEVQKAIVEAQGLVKLAKQTPRPSTPPEGDPLFQRPKDAPLSDYEKRVKAYDGMLDHHQRVQRSLRVLQERVARLQEQVKKLKTDHVPAKKMGKVEHDIESLENVSANLDVAMLKLSTEVGAARQAAM